jgi:hypothetical protein
MGFTWENELQIHLKRAKAGDLLLGTAAVHRRALLEQTRQERERPGSQRERSGPDLERSGPDRETRGQEGVVAG